MMKALMFVASMALTFSAGQAVSAATYDFRWDSLDEVLAGTLTTSTSGSAEEVTSWDATLNGVPIYLAPPGAIGFLPPNDNLIYPNMTGASTSYFLPSGGYLDGGGIGFYVPGYVPSAMGTYAPGLLPSKLAYVDDDSDGIGGPTYWIVNTVTVFPSLPGTFKLEAVSAAPEPSTWELMFAAVMMIGGLLRLSRQGGARRRLTCWGGVAGAAGGFQLLGLDDGQLALVHRHGAA